MSEPKLEDIRKMSDVELIKALHKAQRTKVVELVNLRNKQTHEQKIYHRNKKLVAQIHTEMKARSLNPKPQPITN